MGADYVSKYHYQPVLVAVMSALTGSLLTGYNIAGLSNALNFIPVEFDWCEDSPGEVEGTRNNDCSIGVTQRAFVQCGVFIGATIACLLAVKAVRKGRRYGLIWMHLLFFVGSVLSALCEGFISLFVARLISGAGIGLATVTVPMYISEISPVYRRGAYVTMHQLLLKFGIVIATGVGYPLSFPAGERSVNLTTFDAYYWRVLLAIPGVIALLSLFLFFSLVNYETPHYMIRTDESNKADPYCLLRVMYNKKDVDFEYEQIRRAVSDAKIVESQQLSLMKALKSNVYRGPIIIAASVSMFQQLSGINVLITNSFKLYTMMELGDSRPFALGLTLVGFFASFIPMFLIDKFGRKPLLMIGVAGQGAVMCIAAISVGVTFGNENQDTGLWLAFAATYCFNLFFGFAYGPIFWVFLHEIFPGEIRSSAVSFCTAINWFGCIVVLFPSEFFIKVGSDPTLVFTFLTILNAIGLFIIVVWYKETKGRTIDDSPYFKGKERIIIKKPVAV